MSLTVKDNNLNCLQISFNKKNRESQERKEKLLFHIEEKYFHNTFHYLAESLCVAWTTLVASAIVKEQQWHQGLFGSLNPSRCHAESGHKLSVTCIYNLILPVTSQRPHDHRPGKHGSLRRKQSSEWCPDWQSNTLHCFPLLYIPELFYIGSQSRPPFI